MRSITIVSTLITLAVSAAADCVRMGYVTHTFFGYPDNYPPGAGIAYDCGRGYTAGGTGTYDDPLTFASALGEFDQCEIIYDPFTQKYLRLEDDCEACEDDWNNNQLRRLDVWTGSTTDNGGQAQLDCENDLTPGLQSQTIVRQPAADLPVDSTPLFSNGQCNTDHVYWDYDINDYCWRPST